MAYFGWPAAHDNDAECAARAGLAILDAIVKLNDQPHHANLSAQVGIDSGTVVIGKGAGNEAEVFGDVPNIAARVQATAEPGTVAITDATHRLVSGLFVVEDCGGHQLKGIERPINIYRVIQPGLPSTTCRSRRCKCVVVKKKPAACYGSCSTGYGRAVWTRWCWSSYQRG
jgi:class 3 adenylate cyclase